MKKLILLALLLCAPAMVWGAQYHCSSNGQSGAVSTMTWTGCNLTYPNNGGGNTYDVTITAGDTVCIDGDYTWQTTVASNNAITVAGTSSSVYGTLNGSCNTTTTHTLTLIGFNNTNAYVGNIARYGTFNTQGLKIQGDVGGADGNSYFFVNGILNSNLGGAAGTNKGVYNASTSYSTTDIVAYASLYGGVAVVGADHFFHYYQSLVNSNVGNTPDSSPTQWLRINTFWTANPSGTGCSGSGCINWNTASTAVVASTRSLLDNINYPLVWAFAVVPPTTVSMPVSNAAGTGLGHFGDSSFSCKDSATNTTVVCVTEKSTIDQVLSSSTPGDYWVDYTSGAFIIYNPSTASIKTTFKYLTYISYSIIGTGNTTYNELVFDHSSFQYVGTNLSSGNGLFDSIRVANKQTDHLSGSTHRKFVFTNNSMFACRVMGLGSGGAGASGDSSGSVPIDGNSFVAMDTTQKGIITVITTTAVGSNYVSAQNNYVHFGYWSGNGQGFIGASSGTANTFSNWTVNHNYISGGGYGFYSFTSPTLSAQWPDAQFADNTYYAYAAAFDVRFAYNPSGTSGHPFLIHDNVLIHPHRAVDLGQYAYFYNNVVTDTDHHFVTGPSTTKNSTTSFALFSGSKAWGNIMLNGYTSGMACLQFGYADLSMVDSFSYYNNTCHNPPGYSAAAIPLVDFGDCGDCTGPKMYTNVMAYNNLGSNLSYAYARAGNYYNSGTSNYTSYQHILRADYNASYNILTSFYVGSTTIGAPNTMRQVATFTNSSGGEYNVAAHNVTGVTLANPSLAYSAGGSYTLAWAYTSPTSITLAWGGGTPVSVIQCNGTTTSASSDLNTNIGVLTDTASCSSGGWPAGATPDATLSTSPVGRYILMTSGVASGEVRRVMYNSSATVLDVAPSWGTTGHTPGNGDSYVLLQSEVTLTDVGGTNSVYADIQWGNPATTALTPVTSVSDTGIGIQYNNIGGRNSTAGINPNYRNPNVSIQSGASACHYRNWDAGLGGAGTETSTLSRLATNTGPDAVIGQTSTAASLIAYYASCMTPMNGQLNNAGASLLSGDIAPNFAGTSPGASTYPAAINSN